MTNGVTRVFALGPHVMSTKADIAAVADEIEVERPELAARLRAAIGKIKVGRPEIDPLTKARQKRVWLWMIEEVQTKNRPRKQVFAEAVRKHGGKETFWANLYTLKGRPPDYFD